MYKQFGKKPELKPRVGRIYIYIIQFKAIRFTMHALASEDSFRKTSAPFMCQNMP